MLVSSCVKICGEFLRVNIKTKITWQSIVIQGVGKKLGHNTFTLKYVATSSKT